MWSSDTIHNRLKSNQSGVLKKQYGFRDLDGLREGDRVGLRLSHDGKLVFFVNGQSQGLAAEEVHEGRHDVYVVVDHYANCKATIITRAGTYLASSLEIYSQSCKSVCVASYKICYAFLFLIQ